MICHKFDMDSFLMRWVKDKLEDMDDHSLFASAHRGHDFPWAIVTQPMGIFQTQGCHMKDRAIIFSKTPFALLLVEWVGQSELSKSSTF